MARKFYTHLNGQNIVELQNFKLNPVPNDPTTPVIGVPWFNTTTGRLKVHNGTSVQVLATLADLGAGSTPSNSNLLSGSVLLGNGVAANTRAEVVPAFLAGGKIYSYLVLMNNNIDITSELEVQVNQTIPKISFVPTVDTGFLNVYFTGTTV